MKRRIGVGFALALVLSPGLAARAVAQYQFEFAFGSHGFGSGQFESPFGVAVDATGRIVVADTGNDRVQVFDSHGNPLFTFGGFGTGSGSFFAPERVAIDPAGRIIVADTGNDRVQVFDAQGHFLFRFGGVGSTPGKFDGPSGIAVPDGQIIVADFFNHRVQVFDDHGVFVSGFGSSGSGQLNGPSGVAVADGQIIVTDFLNHRVQVFDAHGAFVSSFGSFGSGPGQFNGPSGVAVVDGQLIVTDFLNHRVQVFDAHGAFVSSFGSFGSGPGQFNNPSDLAVAAGCRIMVADTSNHRIQVFASPGSSAPVITATVSPEPNADGWNKSDVAVTLSASSPCGSGVKEIEFALSGAQTGGGVVSGDTASVTIPAEGVTTLSYFARDNAGGQGVAQTLTVRIDKTAPSIACSSAPPPNAGGWNNTDVTVSFAASDALAGIDTAPGSVVVTTEGADQVITRTVTDRAGNSASATCRVSVDKTPPTVVFGAPSPPPNAAGWNNSDISIPFTVVDSLSGVASVSAAGPLLLTAEGIAVSGSVAVADLAGNTAAFTSPGANIDKTPPAVACSVTPAVLWPPNHSMVELSASVTVTDSLSGPAGFVLASVTSNEADANGELPEGAEGFVVGTSDTDGLLRAERRAGGTGRVYTLSYTGLDLAGNSAGCEVSVTVPHDQGK